MPQSRQSGKSIASHTTRCIRPEFVDSDNIEVAKAAGLRYVKDQAPGIRRKRLGKHFIYTSEDGQRITDENVLARIAALGIPPAWTDVWICPTSRGHVQATGRDAKGRKQYRYHPRWREVRDETKYDRMIGFAEALSKLRARVDDDLRQRGLSRERVLATVVRLLDETNIRVGNEEYARENQSYGLTTLQSDHVDVGGETLHFHFRGKSGKQHEVAVRDRRVAKIVKQVQDLPGHELFQYLDDEGTRHTIESADVNEYLRSIMGEEYTAKDFRTWAGSVVAARTLREEGPYQSETEAREKISEAVKEAAQVLGNTPTICRKCYVHPAVIDAFLDGTLLEGIPGPQERVRASTAGLSDEETKLLTLLRRREHESERSGMTG